MTDAYLVLFVVFIVTHAAHRASFTVWKLPRRERPMLYADLGVVGEGVPPFVANLALVCMVSSLTWGVLNLSWLWSIALFAASGLAFGLLHRALYLSSVYRDFAYGVGPLVALPILIGSQVLLWKGHWVD